VRTGVALWVALAMYASAAGAELQHQSLGPEMVLFEDPIVSAATKSDLGASAAPAAVSVITRTDIRRHGYRTLAEALRTVRGFYSSNDRNYSSIGARGFLRPGDYNDRILLLVNGHTYNDDVFREALLGQEFGIDMEAIERIEVIRGPGSALYGGNALFAVINVVTVGAMDADGVRPLVETGSFGRKRGQLSVGRTFANGTDVFASGSLLDVDGPATLFYPELDSPETSNGIARNADGERAYNGFVSVRRGDFFLQGAYNQRSKEIPTGAFGTLFNDDDSKTVDSRSFAELAFSRDLRPGVNLTARVYYDGFYYRGNYVYHTDGGGLLRNLDHAWSHWGGTEVRARWEVFSGNVLTAGAEFTYHPDAFQDNYDVRPRVTYFHDHRAYDEWGVYLQDEWALRSDLELVTGVRFDRYDDKLNDVSPRVAVIWSPRERTDLKLLYGRAFRPPNLYEEFYTTPQSDPIQLGNSELRTESIQTYEAVLEHRLAGGAQGMLAFYRYDLHRLIDNVPVDDGAATQFRNLDGIEAWGAEVEARIPLRDRVALRADYAYADARTKGHLLTNSPHHLGHAELLFPLPYGAEGGVDLQVIGPRLTLQHHHVETAHLLNVTVNLPPIRGFRLSGSVYNLFDQRYADPGGPEHVQDRIPQDGLTFRVALQYVF
jgi:outer membrane receptor protein involved in Fe transport